MQHFAMVTLSDKAIAILLNPPEPLEHLFLSAVNSAKLYDTTVETIRAPEIPIKNLCHPARSKISQVSLRLLIYDMCQGSYYAYTAFH